MDVNWYTMEKMVDDVLRAQRAKAEVAHHAAIARRHPTHRLIGTVLSKLGRTLVAESRLPVSEETVRGALTELD